VSDSPAKDGVGKYDEDGPWLWALRLFTDLLMQAPEFKKLKPCAKLVLCDGLLWYARFEGMSKAGQVIYHTWVGSETLAKRLQVAHSTVCRQLTALEDRSGLVGVVKRGGGTGLTTQRRIWIPKSVIEAHPADYQHLLQELDVPVR